METLTIIGAGNVGKSMGRLWARSKLLEVRHVINRTLESAKCAVEFIGQGQPVSRYDEIAPSDWVMISVPDDQIEFVCAQVAELNVLALGATVFHCSGSRPSSLLEPVRRRGCKIASMHPVKSFADPLQASQTFAQTPCGIEGDDEACLRLEGLVVASGAKPFRLDGSSKLLYHAGTVMVCNYLTALLETGFRCYEAAGIPRARAMELASPIVAETVRNVFKSGTVAALTGPIARGDARLVADQSIALQQWDSAASDVYKALGAIALQLAREKGAAPEALASISETIG